MFWWEGVINPPPTPYPAMIKCGTCSLKGIYIYISVSVQWMVILNAGGWHQVKP